jgi:hypothetical protein
MPDENERLVLLTQKAVARLRSVRAIGDQQRGGKCDMRAIAREMAQLQLLHAEFETELSIIASEPPYVLIRNYAPKLENDKPAIRQPAVANEIVVQEAWMFFLPKVLREAFFREWLEERDMHRARGRSEVYIRFTLFAQLATMFIVGGRDKMAALVRKLWNPAHE